MKWMYRNLHTCPNIGFVLMSKFPVSAADVASHEMFLVVQVHQDKNTARRFPVDEVLEFRNSLFWKIQKEHANKYLATATGKQWANWQCPVHADCPWPGFGSLMEDSAIPWAVMVLEHTSGAGRLLHWSGSEAPWCPLDHESGDLDIYEDVHSHPSTLACISEDLSWTHPPGVPRAPAASQIPHYRDIPLIPCSRSKSWKYHHLSDEQLSGKDPSCSQDHWSQ